MTGPPRKTQIASGISCMKLSDEKTRMLLKPSVRQELSKSIQSNGRALMFVGFLFVAYEQFDLVIPLWFENRDHAAHALPGFMLCF